jgi:hypothetical protein
VIRDVSREKLPEDQRTLLAALGRFLRGHSEATAPASQHLDHGLAAFLL